VVYVVEFDEFQAGFFDVVFMAQVGAFSARTEAAAVIKRFMLRKGFGK
jgi:hypothetical protein